MTIIKWMSYYSYSSSSGRTWGNLLTGWCWGCGRLCWSGMFTSSGLRKTWFTGKRNCGRLVDCGRADGGILFNVADCGFAYIYVHIYLLFILSFISFQTSIILIKSYWSGTANRRRRSNLIIANFTLIRVNVCREISFTVSQGHIRFVFSFSQVQWFIKIFVNEVILRAFLTVYVPTWWHANQMNL